MNRLRLLVFTSTSVLSLGGLILGACSSDDTIVPGTDSGDLDAGGGKDSPTANQDGNVPTDAPDDRGPDVKTVGDAGLNPQNFFGLVASKICGSLARCCYGNANVADGGAVDGGTFAGGRCGDLYRRIGFEGSSSGIEVSLLANVEIDQAKAVACLDKLDALACSQTGATLQDARAACFDAVKGKLAANTPCRATIECGPALFCNPPSPDAGSADGGIAGTCTPLRAQGQNCSIHERGNDDEESQLNEVACSYRGGGAPQLRCDSYDFVAQAYRPRSQWTCQPTVANGQGCNTSVWCKEGVCNPDNNYTCQSPLPYFNQYVCGGFIDK